jgi:hypothetical protein
MAMIAQFEGVLRPTEVLSLYRSSYMPEASEQSEGWANRTQ